MLLGTLLAGCGVPSSTTVRTIDPADVPPAFSTRPRVSATLPARDTPEVYYADSRGHLIAVPIGTEAAQASKLETVLSQLTGGPTAEQTKRGLTTALPPAIALHLVSVTDGMATLALGGDQLPQADQTTAIAQIVLSATSVPGITSVRITLNDRPLEAPLIGGALTTRPLTAADYLPLARVNRTRTP